MVITMTNDINWLGNNVVDNGYSQTPQTRYSPNSPNYQRQNGTSQRQTPPTNNPTPNSPSQTNQTPPGSGTQPKICQSPPPLSNEYYIPGYLVGLIGKTIRAEFFINNAYMDRVGILREVGVNYFVLQEISMQTYVMCDLYSVRFVTVLD
ncbi:MAG: hypothetical protein PHH84_03385 [Oscillospiraceae bacterium]|nr:hypothetical protein [Oscillospiraceae bacterium]MDD4413371.1 hypothetical protein [Oscillospiraceae bacterium]